MLVYSREALIFGHWAFFSLQLYKQTRYALTENVLLSYFRSTSFNIPAQESAFCAFSGVNHFCKFGPLCEAPCALGGAACVAGAKGMRGGADFAVCAGI